VTFAPVSEAEKLILGGLQPGVTGWLAPTWSIEEAQGHPRLVSRLNRHDVQALTLRQIESYTLAARSRGVLWAVA
jgi:hypothetical protein